MKQMPFQGIKSLFRHPDLGLFIMRVALGAVFAVAGYKKFMAGEQVLNAIGGAVKYVGLDVGSNNISTLIFGIAAAGVEAIGGVLMIAGYLFRISSFLLFGTMIVATLMMYDSSGGDVTKFGFPMVMGLVSLGLLLTGPGSLSLQKE